MPISHDFPGGIGNNIPKMDEIAKFWLKICIDLEANFYNHPYVASSLQRL